MLKLTIFSVVAGFCLAMTVEAQPDTAWTRTYGGEESDKAYSVIRNNSGGYVLCGNTESFGNEVYDGFILAIGENGDSLWSRVFGGESLEGFSSMIQLDNGGFIAVGSTRSFGEGMGDFWIIRLDGQGDAIWTQTYGTENDEGCTSVIQTSDGGFALVGYASDQYVFPHPTYVYLIKIDSVGNVEWENKYGDFENSICNNVIELEDDSFILTGTHTTNEVNRSDFLLMRVDSDGDSLWSKLYGGDGIQSCKSSLVALDGSICLAGTRDWNFLVINTNVNGDSLWGATYGTGNVEKCNMIIQTGDEGYALAGYRSGAGADFWLLRIDESGDSLWTGDYSTGYGEECNTMALTPEGGFLLVGTIDHHPLGSKFDISILKTTPDPVSVSNDPLVQYPLTFSLIEPFPNPFNSSLSITFRTTRPGIYALDVVDPTGRRLGVISEGFLPAGERRMNWNANDLPPGIYWLRLTDARGGTEVKPILLVK